MKTVSSSTVQNNPAHDEHHEDDRALPGKPKRSRLRRIGSFFWSLLLIGIFILLGLQLGGFARYAYLVTTPAKPITENVDGIIALTGGEKRIRGAMELFRQGKGARVLITGVNPDLSDETIRKLTDIDPKRYDCCVDIDRIAKDTIGNALAARDWAKEVDAKSLIVVTGAFHMPRAIREFSHAMPNVSLIPYPVNVPQGEKWWQDKTRLRDMLREYVKLFVVTMRDHINEWTGQSWPAMPLRGALFNERS